MFSRRKLGLIIFALLSALLISGCAGQLPRVIPAPVTPAAPPTTASTAARQPQSPGALSADASLLALPSAFRYQVVLRYPGSDTPPTLIVGQYRDGQWQQSARASTGGELAADEELVVARDPKDGALRSFSRAQTDSVWTRWPGIPSDRAYGLSSPFTLLRLRPLAAETATPEGSDAGAGPAGTTKTRAFFPEDTVKRLLIAGFSAVTSDPEALASLESVFAAQAAPQTLTYWTDAQGRVAQAVGTLLVKGPDGQPMPLAEVTASYTAYDDPSIQVTAPAEAYDINELVAAPDDVGPRPELETDPAAGVTLRVRVFATAGQPAGEAIVTVYQKNKKTVVDEKLGADAQFKLKPGQYDVLARAGGAEQWLKDVAVTEGAITSNDVLFDFAPLTVNVTLGGAAPPVDVVVYPAGERVRFAGFATANPARFLLPAGLYDVEVGAIDGSARKRVDGVEVRGGLETTQTIDLGQP
ncbi:MAG: hypothetical protein MUC34_07060 [Anaerolineae bacterium]|jgi:hypothetical protein|nr:hypothetical protein [Anaerolineae bacterium]